jgi:hypothetical protein
VKQEVIAVLIKLGGWRTGFQISRLLPSKVGYSDLYRALDELVDENRIERRLRTSVNGEPVTYVWRLKT